MNSTLPRSPLVSPRPGLLLACCIAASAWTGVAHAGLPEQLATCRAINSDTQRLACYDVLGRSRDAASAPAPTATVSSGDVVVPSPASPPAAKAEESFGSDTVVIKKVEQGPQKIQAHVVGELEGVARGLVLQLDNGQVWQSIDDREYPSYEGSNPAVSIERNFAGSYWMRLTGGVFNLRVARIK